MKNCMYCGVKLSTDEQEYYGFSCNACEGYYSFIDDGTGARPFNWLRRIWNAIRNRLTD